MRARLLLHAWLQLVLWIAIAGVANHLAHTTAPRIDLTADRRHTLSETAREAIRALPEPVVATVWFSGDLAAPYHDHLGALLDLLGELQAVAPGQLRVLRVDPSGDAALTERARRRGIEAIPYTRAAYGRREARRVFMGVELVSGIRRVSLPALTAVETMEVELVQALLALGREERRPVVGVLQGHGEPDLASRPEGDPLARLRDRLYTRYSLRSVLLDDDEPVPADVEALLVLGPQGPVSPAAQLHLDQYLMGGGAIAWFVSGFQPDFRTLLLREVDHGLHAMLGHHGVTLGREPLVDRTSNEVMTVPVTVGTRPQLARANTPLALVTTAFDREHAAVRHLPRAVLPFATALTVAPSTDEVSREVWLRTETSAAESPGLIDLRLERLTAPRPGEKAGPFAVLAALSGRFDSYFRGRELPEEAGVAPEALRIDGAPARMLVLSSGDAVPNSPDLVLNAVDWLLDDPRLIGIRARRTAQPALPSLSRGELWRYRLVMVGVPLALLLLGTLAIRRMR